MIDQYEIVDYKTNEVVDTLFDRDIANETWLALSYKYKNKSFFIRPVNSRNNKNGDLNNFRNNYLKNTNMAYNGQYGGGGQRNYNTNYRGGQYQGNNNYRGNGGRNNAPDYVKKSGADSKLAKNGKVVTWGWKASKRFGMIKFFCAPTKYTKEGTSKTSGKKWISGIAVTVTNQQTGSKTLHWGMMYPGEGNKVVIDSLGLVVNPKGGRGGVVARIGVKK